MGTDTQGGQSVPRNLCDIAAEIRADWGPKVSPYAKPYLDAMATLRSIDENFYLDSGHEIVLRFLCNASTWRGEVARRVKAELKAMARL